MLSSQLKDTLLLFCRAYAQARIQSAQEAMESAQQAANEEGKSSMGDKYETTRAMMQIARDQAAQQLVEAQKLNDVIGTISATHSGAVAAGSVVFCEGVNFYLGISAGVATVDGREFITLATTAPLGQQLLGKKPGDVVQFKGRPTRIVDIV